MSDAETLKEFGRRGWSIKVETRPDYDYEPGRDDDVYPRLTPHDPGDEVGDGDLGPFPGVVQGEYYRVTAEEVTRLFEIAGASDFDEFRAQIGKTARDIANGQLRWIGVIATARRGKHVLGTSSLWGVDDDGSEDTAPHIREVADEVADEAIAEAEAALRELCDGLGADCSPASSPPAVEEGLDDQHCPSCLSLNICQQTREDQEPWACLDCAAEFGEPLEPETVEASRLSGGHAVKAPGSETWSLIRCAGGGLCDGTVTVELDWGSIMYREGEKVDALV